MIEPLTGGGFIVDLTILSKEQTEILECEWGQVFTFDITFLTILFGGKLCQKN